ncbi:AAA family ATPase [Calditerrivibrio nitroreducens]|uniref:ATPase associated with various cellular activities AAA_3 n=1 Tax=Calditerrivibrio nitroreducens (strain DSM 19672 / NBRC 101217 / Yu37-1) TaxID=768670 RepID=E4TFC6_CALNY|nr:MoxR family ATPase [Calditerrivibrio nitroreducens]ADR18465.1 ATPase associated with various cellular activities AAA_3 [Calditerrivibrio nitroreducens DSM 19672]
MEKYQNLIHQLFDYYQKYLQGKEKAIKLTIISFLSRGHVLIEDNPGLGKTTLAIAIAKSMGLTFGRIQCTNDLLPTDVTGLNIFNKEKNEFEFKKGPIFNNIVLIDEINRATPKTQSALLEAMGEKQVTVEGSTYNLPQPFFVIATQNPSESFGTFPLPESQLDRFLMKISIGYPRREEELDILRGGSSRKGIYESKSVISSEDVLEMIQYIKTHITVKDNILEYIMDLVDKTRNHPQIAIGLSTRAALSIVNAARSSAFINGRDYVIPEDILDYYQYTMLHRMTFKERLTSSEKLDIITSMVKSTKLPYA